VRLRKLHLRAFGPFTNRILDFGTDARGLILVQGPNEVGKSSALRAISDLRFGIPTQSKDDFVHSHPAMRIGGEFVDRNGKGYSLMRRKGRTGTLHFADFLSEDSLLDKPAPPEIELLLNCGLTKEQHDSMFGIDHKILRQGGEALLRGEGEVGVALFEASAGGRSVPEILDRLDGSARKYFMPGTRARNAKINEALAAYEQHQAAFRQAQIRPSVWTELSKKQKLAAEELTALERRHQEIHGQLLLIRELRSVAPLLVTLDSTAAILEELKATPLLTSSAATDRATAEKGLSDARYNAHIAAADLERHLAHLSQLRIDDCILSVAPAVRRLVSSSETIDQHRREMDVARVEAESLTRELSRLAAAIAPALGTSDVVAKIPTKVERATIDIRLRAAEQARQAVDQHRASASRPGTLREAIVEEPPTPEVRAALQIAQSQVTRSDSDLKRLAVLPTEIKASQRAVAQALAAANVVHELAFERLRPLLDAQIDGALKHANENTTRRTGYVDRIREVTQAIQVTVEQRDRLFGHGEVATWDEVTAARALRESGWELVREAYIDRAHPMVDDRADGKSLLRVYEDAVKEADRLVDALARDTQRAAELQACKDNLSKLERDRDDLNLQLGAAEQEDGEQNRVWEQILASAGLPSLSPAALRDWQALLPAARKAIENMHTKVDELDRVRQIESSMAGHLRAALLGTGLATPAMETTLGTLIAMASEIEQKFRQQEAARERAAGEEAARATQLRQWSTRDAELSAQRATASATLQGSLTDILLPEGASEEVVRARLAEFDQLSATYLQLEAARRNQARSEQSLSQIVASAQAIWEHLEDQPPADLRIYGEQLAARLDAADAAQTEQTLAQQALNTARASLRDHEAMVQRYSDAILALCRAAGVESPSALPAAEEMSRRKREAQDSIDRTRALLAQASKRTIDDLRSLLQDQDAVQIDTQEATLIQEQETLTTALAAARQRDESARRDLNAIDGSDTAVVAREAMERAASSIRASMAPWIRSKIAHSLLAEALKRFRDRAQGPMLTAASTYFARMTRDRFVRLVSDDSGKEVVLVALRSTGARIHVHEMSEGTRDQLYLALRLAALDFRRAAGVDLPIILDDILITSDDDRSAAILEALSDAALSHQVIAFTHHKHIAGIATQSLSPERLRVVTLDDPTHA
jgi:DNA repair protein SbcC/Rad50